MYEIILERIDELMRLDPQPDSKEGIALLELVALVEKHEKTSILKSSFSSSKV